MTDHGTPPGIPTVFQQYNSYVIDPHWQKTFSIIWATAVGAAIVFSSPRFLHAVKNGRAYQGLFGISEDLTAPRGSYAPVAPSEKLASSEQLTKGSAPKRRRVVALVEVALSSLRWTLPGMEVDFGQMLVVTGYLVALLVCLTKNSELVTNPNRGGFLALAQFPVVFLFATKNNILSLLLGPGHGYEKLNYIHRWAGRGLFIAATVHGALWIRNHLQYGLPIIGQQKETSGVAAFGVLCCIVITSWRPVRRMFHQFFFITHVLGFVAFYVTICYHTTYAPPWIYPPLAFYGLDMLMRMLRYRVKDATLVAVDQEMTLIHIHDCDAGWHAGQHVRLRVFFNGRVFEAHPLTVLTAPPSISCLSTATSYPGTLTLAARVRGDWTRALNVYAQDEANRLCCEKEQDNAQVQVMLDGAYGGCSIDLGAYESVFMIAGGSGATFTLGLLDDIVGRCVRLGRRGGERTRRVEFAWCVRSFGCIEWFASQLTDIANAVAASDNTLDLHISIYVTCLCNPEAVPPIPNSVVTVHRPSVGALLRELVTPPTSSSSSSSSVGASDDMDIEAGEEKLAWAGLGGGVAVCASGPETLVRETQNAVARLGTRRGVELGGVGLHTELFAL